MREIKFRGKRVDNGEWAYGYLVEGILGSFILPFEFAFPSNSMNTDLVEVIPETVGEFTGLKDSKGVEIYEGDIIQSVSDMILISTNEKTGEVAINNYEVRWENERARWGRINKNGNFELLYGLRKEPLEKYYTVIGNIYENPELLENQ